MVTLSATIVAVVDGDLSGMDTIRAVAHRTLWDAVAETPQLIVTRSALIKVLEDWKHGHYTAEEIQRWASFIRRGYVAERVSERVHPISIDYDIDDEALIVEVIGRLDEIGDLIDGQIKPGEQEEMLLALRNQ